MVDSVFPVLDTHGIGLERLIAPLAAASKDSSSNDNEDTRLLAKRCLSLLKIRSSSWISSTTVGGISAKATISSTPILDVPLPLSSDVSHATNTISSSDTNVVASEPSESPLVQKQILEKNKVAIGSSPPPKEVPKSSLPKGGGGEIKEPYRSSSRHEPSKKEEQPPIKEEKSRTPTLHGPAIKVRRFGQNDLPRSSGSSSGASGDFSRSGGVNDSFRTSSNEPLPHHRHHRFDDDDRTPSSSRPAIRSFSSSSSYSSDRRRRQDSRVPSRRY